MKQSNSQQLDNLRHSCAHLLAKAVKTLWPGAKNAIGPAIENGFYQDFDMGDVKLSESDLPKIEAKMAEILPSWQHFEYGEVSLAEAKKLFADNPYKIEMAQEFATGGKKLQTNNPGDFLDLCKMGHVENPTKELQHFKLLKIAGAYWRGSEKNKMLTRIYGTAWPTKQELDDYLVQQEEAEKNDHRQIGKDLDLFVFSDLVGKGLPLLTPKGATIRRELERWIVDEEIKRGYLHVKTPDLANLDLYRTSGHYPYYKETMYPPMKVDEEELMLRPMTCPHHFMYYRSRPRTYRELPMRIAELANLYRYEKSGELTGLLRVRTFCLADAHIVASRDQAEQEIGQALDLIDHINKTLGLEKGKDYRYRLSLGDRKDEKKYYKDDAGWDFSENILRNVLTKNDHPHFEAEGEAAFYGPKIDVQVKNAHGKEETAFTVQYDFVMPKRFGLKFINSGGKEEEPIVVHRSSIGALERTMAFLIERYKGAFPTWLAPVQVIILPIADRHLDYANSISYQLKFGEAPNFSPSGHKANSFRVEVDDRAETLGAKIRDAQLAKIPYMIIVGDKEVEGKRASIRSRDRGDLGPQDLKKFIGEVRIEIEEKRLK